MFPISFSKNGCAKKSRRIQTMRLCRIVEVNGPSYLFFAAQEILRRCGEKLKISRSSIADTMNNTIVNYKNLYQ